MRLPNSRPAWALLMFLGCMAGANAADGKSPQQCAAIGDDLERLACYDRIYRTPASTVPAGAGPASTAVGPAATVSPDPKSSVAPAAAAAGPGAPTPQDDFGLTEAAKQARLPEESRKELPESVSGKVAKVARRPAGEFIVTLENGQVWTQLQVDPRARIAVGDTVTIKKAALGSYLLVTASRYATRVRRVK